MATNGNCTQTFVLVGRSGGVWVGGLGCSPDEQERVTLLRGHALQQRPGQERVCSRSP